MALPTFYYNLINYSKLFAYVEKVKTGKIGGKDEDFIVLCSSNRTPLTHPRRPVVRYLTLKQLCNEITFPEF
jgi:hypothetical protein